MKIKEILELTMTTNVPTIAKEHLSIGEKKLRDALKSIGCTSDRGKKGWAYNGDDPEVLEKSIYDFVTQRTQKVTANNAIKERNNPENKETINKEKQNANKKENLKRRKEENNKMIENERNITLKKVTYEVEEKLHNELKIKSILENRKVSELVNAAIKEYLK